MSPTTRRIAIVGLMLIAAVCVRLGFWQVERLAQRRAVNQAALAARTKPALDLEASGEWTAEQLSDRWVEALGESTIGTTRSCSAGRPSKARPASTS